MFTRTDHEMMSRAIRLAERGRYSAHPNPRVGCVITRNDEIVAEGWHRRTGEAHAEINALEQVADASGTTIYVTLEPCTHHGRTPPCVNALIKAQPARVVVAIRDPNPAVTGKGVAELKGAGIKVNEGLLEDEAGALNYGFTRRMTAGRPRVLLKLAASLDGRTALHHGKSKWITGEAAREDVHRLRAECGAVMTGSGTVKHDDPLLNVRLPGEWLQPLRVVIDGSLSIPPGARILSDGGSTIIFTTGPTNSKQVTTLQSGTVEIVSVASAGGKCDLAAVLDTLAEREINDLLVECGPGLAGAMLKQELVDECVVYLAPHLLGQDAKPLVQLFGIDKMDDRIQFGFEDVTRIGEDLKIRLRVSP